MRHSSRLPVWLGRTIVALAAILFLSTSAQAAFIALAWDPNPEPDIAGYVLFYGTATGSYPNSVDVGNITTWNSQALNDGQQYFFAVLAYDTTGARSELSDELTAKPFAAARMVAPLPGSALSSASAQFQWTAGTGVSQYRLSVGTAFGGTNTFDQTLTTTTATVAGLPATGTVFVRLWSLIGTTWNFTDYTYTTAARPTLSITAVSVLEGNSGTQIASFAVKLTPPASSPVTVAYATSNGTATAGSDYAAVSGTLTIAAGASTATVNVTVNGDTAVEPDETFTVTLSNPSANAVIGIAQAVGTIRNDDVAGATGTSYLSDRAWKSMTNGWGPVEKDRSNGETGAADGKALTLNGVTYAKGLGAHAASDIRYALNGACSSLTASVGVDDEVGSNGAIVFQVWTDGVKKYDSGVMTGTTATASVNVNITGATELALIITDGGNGASFDHGDWANAQVTCGATTTTTYLSDRTWKSMVNGWGPVEKDRSNAETAAGDGRVLTLNGVTYAKGLGAHGASDIRYTLGGLCSAVTAVVGVDDEMGGGGSVVFQVWADGVKKYDSGLMTATTANASVNADVTGAAELALVITDGGNGNNSDHGDWANAQITCQ